ncbi:N-alpha-acetyltransferase 15 NatA auxiliary subunit-like protein [Perkinsela sp. CCAP 1560/4]|nr:N-alpha-acetyltransferase 15 NatA auxiliary subunit-like protein [Perkinsela sp. CCAP 1560/4]|eukprot:KNH08056.1 N-alpha-acetyltransferase 15 NatA auxiliary subunit-like protein [Perkinsela sp. CCAP 1560/4]
MNATSSDLPAQWDFLFKQLVKQYETRQYEKALKSAKEILKEFPHHAETLAIKGHVLTYLDQALWGSDVPLEIGRLAVRKNIRSPLCWRILGKIYLEDKNYSESIKCYRQSLKLDTGNLQAMHELATLETQTRDIAGLINTRKTLLRLDPLQKIHWMGLAIALDLHGDLKTATEVVEEFEKTPNASFQPLERSEHDLYKVGLMMRQSRYADVINLLPSLRKTILEEKKLLEIEAECLLHSGRKKEAESIHRSLLVNHPNCISALQGIVCARASFHFSGDFQNSALSAEEKSEIQLILDGITKESSLAKNIALNMCDGPTFATRIGTFMQPFVKLNILSIFSALKPFYKSAEKQRHVESNLLDWEKELEKNQNFQAKSYPNPTALLWVYLLLCTHYIRVSNIAKAEHYAEKAQTHSPTAEAVYLVQARLAKAKGNAPDLLSSLKLTTQMDPNDRYASNRYVKHLLRNAEYFEAEHVFRSFNTIREKDMIKHIVDIECIWYELELANASYRHGDVLTALQIYLLITRQFESFREQEYDFHRYCLNRGSYCAYMDTLRNSENVRSHPSCVRAAHGVVQCLLDIFDRNDISQLESRRTKYGELIAANDAVGSLPDLSQPLVKALEYTKLLEKYDGSNPDSFISASMVYYKLGEYTRSIAKLRGAVDLGGSHDTRVQQLEGMLKGVKAPEIKEAQCVQ